MLPHATQVADPFHVVRAANERLDDTRRRVQQQILGHRGRKSDPLYRTRRLLVMADERLDEPARDKRRGLLAAGDPRGEVADAWTDRKQFVRSTGSAIPTSRSSGSPSSPTRSTIGRTAPRSAGSAACSPGGLPRSPRGIAHAHRTAPWRPINNLAKRVKRVAFGLTNWTHWRVRVLLYAGQPDWSKLATITPVAP